MSDTTKTQSRDLFSIKPKASNKETLRVVSEDTQLHMKFTLMPDRPVGETLFVKEYRFGDRYMEARFDRTYHSAMLRSPDHLIATTVQCHSQKMIYAYLCHEFGLPYDPHASERLKIWCTWFEMDMPKLVRKNHDVLQRLHVLDITKREEGVYIVSFTTEIEESITLNATVTAYLLPNAE